MSDMALFDQLTPAYYNQIPFVPPDFSHSTGGAALEYFDFDELHGSPANQTP